MSLTGPLTPTQRKAAFDAYDGRCARCRRRMDILFYEVNHILPRDLGGTNEPDNLEPLCPAPCHAAITAQQAKGRAKRKRIQAQKGLLKKKPSQKDKAIARWLSQKRQGR